MAIEDMAIEGMTAAGMTAGAADGPVAAAASTASGGPARLPVWLVAGPHSGRNAAWIVSHAWPGRWLWLAGPLQRPLAAQALEAGGADAATRLVLESLPGGCACCAAGAQLGAGLARVLRRQRREGAPPEGLILQLEPDGDPARLADNLAASGADAPWQLEAIVAVVAATDLAAPDLAAPDGAAADGAAAARPTARLLRCLGSAGRVFVRDAAPVQRTARAGLPTPVGPDWQGALLPAADEMAAAGWQAFVHDPFGGSGPVADPGPAASGPWQLLARWPGSLRFDRRAVAGWLAELEQAWRGAGADADAAVEFALIARTERDWLGWHAGGAEIPLAWRMDSRLAVRTGRLEGAEPAQPALPDSWLAAPPLLKL